MQFNDVVRVVHKAMRFKQATKLTKKNYKPHRESALYDAVIAGVRIVEAATIEDNEQVKFFIITGN